jgi:hypothetical protein
MNKSKENNNNYYNKDIEQFVFFTLCSPFSLVSFFWCVPKKINKKKVIK